MALWVTEWNWPMRIIGLEPKDEQPKGEHNFGVLVMDTRTLNRHTKPLKAEFWIRSVHCRTYWLLNHYHRVMSYKRARFLVSTIESCMIKWHRKQSNWSNYDIVRHTCSDYRLIIIIIPLERKYHKHHLFASTLIIQMPVI